MSGPPSHRPTKNELLAARGRSVPDVIGPGLKVLFCGINPGLYSAATGHHFARPGNRFWTAIFRSGFTDRILDPSDERSLLDFDYGITNIVNYATAQAHELTAGDLRTGGILLQQKVLKFRPQFLAVLGIDAYRKAFGHSGANMGPQAENVGGTRLWVLPNPSGINAAYQMGDLTRLFSELREAAETNRAS
jgi:TDG/mug DNA glycosylase family protein